MSEKDVVQQSQQAYTKSMLVKDLKKLGVQEGDCLLVHSSLSSIGWVVGQEITVIEALIEALGKEGTLVIPTFSGGNSEPSHWGNPAVPKEWFASIRENMPPFDPRITPTRGVGIIPDAFIRYPGVKRSEHPVVSFSAYGKYADVLTSHHELSPGFGKQSPLHRLYERNPKVLLLGVGYGNCTCLHLGEGFMENPQYIETGSRIYVNGESQWVKYRDIDYDESDFVALGTSYEETHHVSLGLIGQAKSRLLEMKPLCDFGFQWLQENRKRK